LFVRYIWQRVQRNTLPSGRVSTVTCTVDTRRFTPFFVVILVASPTKGGKPFSDGKARFFLYDLSHKYWKMLPERNLHPKCPLGYDGGKTLAVGSKLYWITEDAMLLVYYLDNDIWVLGKILKGLEFHFLINAVSPLPLFYYI
jgi:hypothetical protein